MGSGFVADRQKALFWSLDDVRGDPADRAALHIFGAEG